MPIFTRFFACFPSCFTRKNKIFSLFSNRIFSVSFYILMGFFLLNGNSVQQPFHLLISGLHSQLPIYSTHIFCKYGFTDSMGSAELPLSIVELFFVQIFLSIPGTDVHTAGFPVRKARLPEFLF